MTELEKEGEQIVQGYRYAKKKKERKGRGE